MKKNNGDFKNPGRGKYFNNAKKNNPVLNKNKDTEAKNEKLSKALKDDPKDVEPEAKPAEAVPIAEESEENAIPLDLGKTTHLVFFKKYDTYQALFEISPKSDISVDECFSKVVLRIMGWFRKRLGEGVFKKYPKIAFLKDEYPEVENFREFDIEKAHDIEGLGFLDVETKYLTSKKAWFFCLEEPDNGQEKQNIAGRAFKTEYFLYREKSSVIFGIRESCREPEDNTKDAKGLRPGIVRDMVYDDDLIIAEYGTGMKNAFADIPIMLNGKSKDSCRELYDTLLNCKYRQMPVLFVPSAFYKSNKKAVNEKTVSYVGYCHVVVWNETCRKLFEQVMENSEFVETAEKGELILYKTDAAGRVIGDHFKAEPDSLEMIKVIVQREPLRKRYNFFDFDFKPNVEDLVNEKKGKDESRILAEEAQRIDEIKGLKEEVTGYRADNASLQQTINELNDKIKRIEKNSGKDSKEVEKKEAEITELKGKITELNDEKTRLEGDRRKLEDRVNGQIRAERARTLPLLKMPAIDNTVKERIIPWIRECYSDLLVVHSEAEKALAASDRNVDWHKLCMIVHYIAGYTKYRNEGGVAINASAAREYDPEEAGFKVDPASSGQGAVTNNKDDYTIIITFDDGTKKDEILDLHVKTGKGGDANMIRVYFTYVPELKKSVIGYWPDHLATRKESH